MTRNSANETWRRDIMQAVRRFFRENVERKEGFVCRHVDELLDPSSGLYYCPDEIKRDLIKIINGSQDLGARRVAQDYILIWSTRVHTEESAREAAIKREEADSQELEVASA